MKARLHEVFGCDLRSLAALRIGLGLALLIDVAMRAQDLRAMYTDAGVLPARVLEAMDGPLVQFSLHYWAGESLVLQALLFAATAVLAIALTAGFQTRPATALCWYLVTSVQIRQPLSYMGGDSMLRLLLFWSLFLPCASRYSLDAAAGRARRAPDRLLNAATVAVLIQVCLMYWATGLRKDGPLWWSGRAIHYALAQDLATPLGEWLRLQHGVLPLLTYGTLWLELLGPCLAFIPFGTAGWRLLTIAIFWMFHIGLASTMNIGLFPLFSMVGWLAFLPTRFWTWCGSVTREASTATPSLGARVRSAAAAVCLVYVVVLVAERARVVPRVLPDVVQQAGKVLRLQQTWNMFAPDPRTTASTYVLQVSLADGAVAERAVGTTFRRRLLVANAGGRLSGDGVMETVAEAVARQACDDRRVVRSALIRRSAAIHDDGMGDWSTHVVVSVACERPSNEQSER